MKRKADPRDPDALHQAILATGLTHTKTFKTQYLELMTALEKQGWFLVHCADVPTRFLAEHSIRLMLDTIEKETAP